jgi:hypothetical protein
VALVKLMRLSLLKAARAVMDGHVQEIRAGSAYLKPNNPERKNLRESYALQLSPVGMAELQTCPN